MRIYKKKYNIVEKFLYQSHREIILAPVKNKYAIFFRLV